MKDKIYSASVLLDIIIKSESEIKELPNKNQLKIVYYKRDFYSRQATMKLIKKALVVFV